MGGGRKDEVGGRHAVKSEKRLQGRRAEVRGEERLRLGPEERVQTLHQDLLLNQTGLQVEDASVVCRGGLGAGGDGSFDATPNMRPIEAGFVVGEGRSVCLPVRPMCSADGVGHGVDCAVGNWHGDIGGAAYSALGLGAIGGNDHANFLGSAGRGRMDLVWTVSLLR